MVPDTVGVILAGGQARRMGGGDKALLVLGGETLLGRAIARATVQVQDLIINANGDPPRFAHLGLPVVAVPLAGLPRAARGDSRWIQWMRANRPKARWLASFACDSPFFPIDMVETLVASAQEPEGRSCRRRQRLAPPSDFRRVARRYRGHVREHVLRDRDGFRQDGGLDRHVPHRTPQLFYHSDRSVPERQHAEELAFAEDFIAGKGQSGRLEPCRPRNQTPQRAPKSRCTTFRASIA